MCWNFNVSIEFGFAHLFTIYLVYLTRPKYYRKLMIFLLFYLIMEWFQALQWYIGVFEESNTCSYSNKVLTILAYELIWLQPVMFAEFVKVAKFAKMYTKFTFIIAMINLFIGLYYPATEMTHLENTNYGNQTCTFLGQHGHLLWKFSVNTISFQPTHYVYYSIILILFFTYYKKELFYTIGLGWISSLLLTIMIHGINNELPAFWCMLSVCADIPIAMYAMHYRTK